MSGKRLWEPTEDGLKHHPMTQFAERAATIAGRMFHDYNALHAFSVEERSAFWDLVWDFSGTIGEKGGTVLDETDSMRKDRFFPEARLNFAENLLAKRGGQDAIVFRGEDKVKRRLSWEELHSLVSLLAQAMRAAGVTKGDRVAAMLPNMPETVAVMLATASIGAVFSSCSPDFGERGVLDRFGQIEPKLLFVCDGYFYNGKTIDVAEKLGPITKALEPTATIVVPYVGNEDEVARLAVNGTTLESFLSAFEADEIAFEPMPFDAPLYIMFSSGTTGVPKCIVHSAGGTLLQHRKEHQLHCGIGDGDRVFYFTTCGWMMWNWLVSALANGATLMLYDGSPFYPDGNVVFDYAAEEKFTFLGTSAKFIDAVRNAGLKPKETHDLSAMRMMTSTGSPLSPEGFDFVYEGIKPDVHLASISGGTDIVSCFVLGVPWLPVHEGEIQGPGLGMAVDVWNLDGKPVRGEKGELVCTKSFPSMPIYFFGDETGERYHNAYFSQFEDIWAHGDFAEWTENDGIIIHGRSDATLNPQGVRIGTAEIYNIVEQFNEIDEAICIGQAWDGDQRVVLFVRTAEGVELSDELIARIQKAVKNGASPRHVPAKILKVEDIPRTKSGKIVELAVREVVEGREVKNIEALANPQALEEFKGRPELST
ncbi:acetyl-coenzyme A synthetase [Fulvimarina pelagi HTCC2506]|uniref:Acetyl-coenzyme A synthetase n=2 Tax=Fulvimarina pelagi TaxID=217511 RepID=Q0G0G1_9HYPH|nr:acetoacetate--CoA ligase [Fulvimarina pelagi]EAU40632.1 acetyl-coenzyme A synthetase [Fulvimarina pelagi HTCC2506]BAT31177.1 acetoacetyl-CoA synthetase [Fulvimarina pelagi]